MNRTTAAPRCARPRSPDPRASFCVRPATKSTQDPWTTKSEQLLPRDARVHAHLAPRTALRQASHREHMGTMPYNCCPDCAGPRSPVSAPPLQDPQHERTGDKHKGICGLLHTDTGI